MRLLERKCLVSQQINFSLTLKVDSVLTPVTIALPGAVQGQSYSFQLQASGGTAPYAFAATGLPAGLSCSVGGLITGTPTTPGNSTVSITVSDSGV
jgi:hypothetical protein